MRPFSSLKTPLAIFTIVAVLYLAVFYGIQHLRERKGPWEIRFTSVSNGIPAISIHQPAIGISNVHLIFPGPESVGTNLLRSVQFTHPRTDVPFGRLLFVDATFLPGTVTLELYGHEIELLPRVLGVDRQEQSWASGMTLVLPQRELPGAWKDGRVRQ